MGAQAAGIVEADALRRQFVTFRVQSKRYGVPIEAVAEMTQIHDVHPISGAPPWILGMMQLRHSVVPVLDLRVRLGLTRLDNEVDAALAELARHRQQHVDGIRHLDSGEPASASGLERSADACPLHHWIQACEAADGPLAGPITRLREPDRRLHALVASCRELIARGDLDGLRRRVGGAEDAELRDLLEACEGAARDLRSRMRQMVVILRGTRENLGLAVDHIDAVSSVDADQILPRPLLDLESGRSIPDLLVASVVRSQDPASLIQILEVGKLFRTSGVEPVAEVDDAAAVRPIPV